MNSNQTFTGKIYRHASLVLMSLFIIVPIAAKPTIIVGAREFTEQIILSEMTAQYLEEKGFKVDEDRGLLGELPHTAIINQEIDIMWEYTGTAYEYIFDEPYNGEKAETIYSKVKAEDAKSNVVWLNSSAVNNTYAFAMNKNFAREKGIVTIDDMAQYQRSIGGLKLATEEYFYKQEDGLTAFENEYDFKFDRKYVDRIELGQIYQRLADGEFDVGLVYSTDGGIIKHDFLILRETRNFFPPYYITPLIRQEVLDQHPELAGYLNELAAILDTEVMTKLNSRVDIDKVYIWEVVEEFLIKKEMLEQ